MKIALLGGTGDVGEGLTLRFGFHTDHEVVVGSRDAERARGKAAEYETELASRGVEREIEGVANAAAADRADVVVLSVPPYHVTDTVRAVRDGLDAKTVLVSPAVGMQRNEDGFHYNRPGAGSVTELVDTVAPDGVPVVGAFHTLSADRLANLDLELDMDAPLVGDDEDAKETVAMMTDQIPGLRPVDAGPLPNAAEVESLTPLLINVAMNNRGMHDLGVQFK